MHDHHTMHLMSTGAFFILGFLGSLHCLGMCGPLSFLLIHNKEEQTQQQYFLNLFIYHGSRTFAYIFFGVFFSLLGQGLNLKALFPVTQWLLVVFLLFFASGLSFSRIEIFQKMQSGLVKRVPHLNPKLRAFLLGSFSPLLPCGLLYAALIGCASAPQVLIAIKWMAVFSLGTIPVLLAGQLGAGLVLRRLIPQKLNMWLRIIALITAVILVGMFLF